MYFEHIYHLVKFDPDWLKKKNIFVYFNTNLYYCLQNGSFWANTSMPTVNPIFHTLLIGLDRYGEFLFMASIDSWRVPGSAYLSFGNRKKSQGAKSGEYGGWAMTFVSCSAKNYTKLDVLFAKNSLSKSESVKVSLIESVICLFTNSSVKKYFSLLNQLLFTDSSVKKYFSLSNQSIFTEIISEIWLIYSNLFLAIWISQISLIISRFWLI